MTSDEIFDTLEKIAKISSNKEREIAVRLAMGDYTFRRVASLACNSFITFGMTGAYDEFVAAGINHFDNTQPAFSVWHFLDNLANRTLTGNKARDAYAFWLRTLSPKSRALLCRILNKDLRCKVTDTILNKVQPGFIPVFDVMLAHKFEEKRILGRAVAAEPKKDGVRVLAIIHNGVATFYSRTGKPFPALDHLRESLAAFCDLAKSDGGLHNHELNAYLGDCDGESACIVLDGEMVSGSFNKTVGDVRRKSVEATDAVFEIFDAIPYKKFLDGEIIDISFRYRRRMLEALFEHNKDPRFSLIEHEPLIGTATRAYEVYNGYRARGFEGAMIKDLDAPYRKSRSHAWLKMKAQESIDIRIKGIFEGQGKYVGSMGGVICDFNGVDVRIGGGFSDEQRAEWWKSWHGVNNGIEGRLICVEYHEITPDGSLRHPRFVSFRDDKDRGVEYDQDRAA